MHGQFARRVVRQGLFDRVTVHAVEPDSVGLRAVRILVRQRSEVAALVPFLARDRAGVAADADIEIDYQAEFLRRGRRQRGHQNGQNIGIRYIEMPQNKAISGMPTFMKSVKR